MSLGDWIKAALFAVGATACALLLWLQTNGAL